MKFYYNDKLIRTSKSHNYTHAAININTYTVIGCRTNKDAAQAIIDTMVNGERRAIENNKIAIKAREAGKTTYWVKEGRHTWPAEVNTIPNFYEDCIKEHEAKIERIRKNWKVVELEAR